MFASYVAVKTRIAGRARGIRDAIKGLLKPGSSVSTPSAAATPPSTSLRSESLRPFPLASLEAKSPAIPRRTDIADARHREIEQSVHRGGILHDFSAQTQTDSLPDPTVP